MCGRAGRGETWRFASLAHEFRARIAGSLAYLERYRLTPDRQPARPWIAGRAQYAGTTIVAHPGATTGAAAELHATLESTFAGDGLCAGVDSVQNGMLLARLLSPSGRPFAAARDAVRGFVLESIFGRSAAAKRK